MCAFKVLFQCKRAAALKTADILLFYTKALYFFFTFSHCYSSFLFISMMCYFSPAHPLHSDIPSAVTSPRFSPECLMGKGAELCVGEPCDSSRLMLFKMKVKDSAACRDFASIWRATWGRKKRRANKERKSTFNSWTRWLFRLWGTASKLQTHKTRDESRNIAEVFSGNLQLRRDFTNQDHTHVFFSFRVLTQHDDENKVSISGSAVQCAD